MDIIIIVLLAIRAWRKGWKAKVFLPISIGFGCCFLFGAMIGASGGSFEAAMGFGVIMDLLIIITLIVMAVRSPKSANADHIEEKMAELRPTNRNYCSVTVPTAQSGQISKASLARNNMLKDRKEKSSIDFDKNQDKIKLNIHTSKDIRDKILKDQKNAAICNNRGVSCRRTGAYQKAIRYYTQAILIKPDFAAAFNNRATALYFMHKFDQAWADIDCCKRVGGTPNPKLVRLLQNVNKRHLLTNVNVS